MKDHNKSGVRFSPMRCRKMDDFSDILYTVFLLALICIIVKAFAHQVFICHLILLHVSFCLSLKFSEQVSVFFASVKCFLTIVWPLGASLHTHFIVQNDKQSHLIFQYPTLRMTNNGGKIISTGQEKWMGSYQHTVIHVETIRKHPVAILSVEISFFPLKSPFMYWL